MIGLVRRRLNPKFEFRHCKEKCMINNQNMRLRYETLQKKIDDICTMDKKVVTRFYFLVVWLVTRVPSGFLGPHVFGIVSGSCVLFPCRLSTRAFPLINSLSFAPIFVLWPSLVSWLWGVTSVSFLCQCTLNTLSSVICFAQRWSTCFLACDDNSACLCVHVQR